MRTAPLWGLRTHPAFLHNGSAATLNDAILAHGGKGSEATVVVHNFTNLTATQRDHVITFLKSL